MNNEVDITAKKIIEYMLETKSSIRATAKHFGCSKTLIWSRINEYKGENKQDIQEQLEINKNSSKFKKKDV